MGSGTLCDDGAGQLRGSCADLDIRADSKVKITRDVVLPEEYWYFIATWPDFTSNVAVCILRQDSLVCSCYPGCIAQNKRTSRPVAGKIMVSGLSSSVVIVGLRFFIHQSSIALTAAALLFTAQSCLADCAVLPRL